MLLPFFRKRGQEMNNFPIISSSELWHVEHLILTSPTPAHERKDDTEPAVLFIDIPRKYLWC